MSSSTNSAAPPAAKSQTRTEPSPLIHKRAASAGRGSVKTVNAQHRAHVPLEYDQRIAARGRVVYVHFSSKQPQASRGAPRRRVREDRQCVHLRANVDHDQRFATSDRVEDAHITLS